MEEFKKALADCNLVDLGFSRLPYTYDNGCSGATNVQVCLDRAMADPSWRDMFSNTIGQHVISNRLDHCPILVELRKDIWDRKGPRLFRYEVMWERVESLSTEIGNEWNKLSDRGTLGGLVHVLENMQKALCHWSKQQFCSVTEELNKLRGRIGGCSGSASSEQRGLSCN
jgi:hypothetical protein